jgi:hypothetical protein
MLREKGKRPELTIRPFSLPRIALVPETRATTRSPALMVARFLFAQWYHVKLLNESDWEGQPASSRADRFATLLDKLGMLLIAIGLVIGLVHEIGRL